MRAVDTIHEMVIQYPVDDGHMRSGRDLRKCPRGRVVLDAVFYVYDVQRWELTNMLGS
jgi:hypothetical protein